jgi:hypothetical protein
MIQRGKEIGQRTSHIEENCVIMEGFIKESNFVKCIAKTVAQYFTSLGKERYSEGMFRLVKRCDKNLNSNGDYVEKQTLSCS